MVKRPLGVDERALGMAAPGVSRRDFLEGALLGAGGALLAAAPAAKVAQAGTAGGTAQLFDGYGGIGPYASANGMTHNVLTAAHRIRDGVLNEVALRNAVPTGERLDLIIVGAGAAGLAAAHRYLALRGPSTRCLVLDNHAVPGGEAKENEFYVRGLRLLAPQGSNCAFVPTSDAPFPRREDYLYSVFKELGLPFAYSYAKLTGTNAPLKFDAGNYAFLSHCDHSDSLGLFLDDDAFGHSRTWIRNPWSNGLRGAAVPRSLRDALLRWRHDLTLDIADETRKNSWLDGMTYRELLTNVHKLPPAVADYTEPLVAASVGLGSTAVSAYCATHSLGLPGAAGPNDRREYRDLEDLSYQGGAVRLQCFPGGNSGLARSFLKALCPAAIQGTREIGDVITGRLVPHALDRDGSPVRIRTLATVIDVRHEASGDVKAIYERDGALHCVSAPRLILANGAWVNKHIVRDLPAELRAACDRHRYSALVCANVALNNWRFLERLGLTACVYTGGEFGFSCNLRRPMHIGAYKPPLDPSQPIVLTFYAPLTYPGVEAAAQGARGRGELLTTPYRELERRLRAQMVRLFGASGFDPARDIAGIVMNRWGHAYVVPEPGFMIGSPERPPPGQVIRRGFDRIGFASAELRGYQNYRGAVLEGRRAAEAALA